MPEIPPASKATRRAIARRLMRRLIRYSSVGVCTYVIDMVVIALLVFGIGLHYQASVTLGFLVGLTLNYIMSYYWVYRGTARNRYVGYAIFMLLAFFGSLIITYSVTYLIEMYHMHLLVARTIIAAFVGLIGFFINTFFNFKLL